MRTTCSCTSQTLLPLYGFRCLGILITDSMSKLFKNSLKFFRSVVEKTGRDFDRWSTLPLSLAARINLIKMVVMPKFLYLFQHIPIYITKSFFDKLDGTISKFLWGNKPARIRKAILQSPKSEGGLALPILRRYYWAANVQKMLYCLDDTCDSPPPLPGHIWKRKLHTSLYGLPYAPSFPSLYLL